MRFGVDSHFVVYTRSHIKTTAPLLIETYFSFIQLQATDAQYTAI